MAEIIRVRDHQQPCEHGSLWAHWLTVSEAKWWQEPECLGGRELILRRIEGALWEEIDPARPGSDPV